MKNTQAQKSELQHRVRMLAGGAGLGASLGITAAVSAFKIEYGAAGLELSSQYIFAKYFEGVPLIGRGIHIHGHSLDAWVAVVDEKLPVVVQAAASLQTWLLAGGIAGAVLGALAVVLYVNRHERN